VNWLLAMIVAVVLAAPPSQAATVRGTVSVDGQPATDTVVYLERVDKPAPPATPGPPVLMDQRNLRFLPAVLPVRQGTVVEFRNSDDVQHNVFTPSEAGGRFDLGTYDRGEMRTVTLDQPGELVILCNIHMEMEAHILVLRDPSFALTDAQGGYRITDIEPGKYMLRVWQKRWLEDGRAVDVPLAADFTLDVPLVD
jgi:plastocyanin